LFRHAHVVLVTAIEAAHVKAVHSDVDHSRCLQLSYPDGVVVVVDDVVKQPVFVVVAAGAGAGAGAGVVVAVAVVVVVVVRVVDRHGYFYVKTNVPWSSLQWVDGRRTHYVSCRSLKSPFILIRLQ